MPTTYAIPNGATAMNATLYTGNGSTQTVNNSAGFYPDFNWIKARSNTGSHVLVNSVAGGTKQLFSNLTDAEQTNTNITNGISSSGIALGNNSAGTGSTNQSAYTYVLWQWLAGAGTAVTNTAGSISSQVSANTTAGFSVVTFTSPASGGFTFGHGLGVTPGMFILKDRTNAGTAWGVWHQSLANTAQSYLQLNSTNAVAANANIWNNTAPTSTLISTQSGQVVLGSANCVAYCFAPVAGYSAFGSYTGNGSTNGPFVYLGFRPRFILLKRSSGAENWQIYDTSRDTYNVAGLQLIPNTSGAEADGRPILDILSNGFKLRNAAGGGNASADYIYAAFAENPFKYANAR
jgi:hypothetical protein